MEIKTGKVEGEREEKDSNMLVKFNINQTFPHAVGC